MVSDNYISVSIPLILFFDVGGQRLGYCILLDVLVRRLVDEPLCMQHVSQGGLSAYQTSDLCLRELQVAPRTVIINVYV